jgi:ADP-heptose:LPS heptosyltransferase
VHVLAHAKVARVLAGHPDADAVIAFDRRRLWLGPLAPGLQALRRARYDVVVDCANWESPSVTSALVSRIAGPDAVVIGPDVWPISRLHSLSVPARTDTRNEAVQRTHLLTPLTGRTVARGLSFREPSVGPAIRAYLEANTSTAAAVINPGGRLGPRRIAPQAFAAAARTLLELGRVPVVTWGPGEEELARSVVEAAPGARLAPPTNLDELAALMRASGLTVCNNTGPMHLSVAVGTPTLAFFLRMDMERWGHAYAPHRMVDLTTLVDGTGGQSLESRVSDEVRTFAAALCEAGSR